ncbi:MAG: hypothetical protein K6G28_04975 [Acholeplasmatales bacterium]|nr:hypothetical protein [Acholeplasmatales bacterium]
MSERSLQVNNLRIKFASKQLFFESKLFKLGLYFIAIIPIVLTVTPQLKDIKNLSFVSTIISFLITLINELIGQFLSNHKEKAILERQFYECEITGGTFSKMEYDREYINDLNELAIRKGMAKLKKTKQKPFDYVPEDIPDEYAYLYIVRVDSAKNNYLLSRMFYIYVVILFGILAAFISLALVKNETSAYFQLIIGFYPLVIPIIRNLSGCKKTSENCAKISADIDNFFADGDTSLERLARFNYYVQNLEFEMLLNRPVMYKTMIAPFKRGENILAEGVTSRFKDSIVEIKRRKLMLDLALASPKGQDLITRKEYTLEELEEKKRKAHQRKMVATTRVAEDKSYSSASAENTGSKKVLTSKKSETKKETKTQVKKTTLKNETVKKPVAKKSTPKKASPGKTTKK